MMDEQTSQEVIRILEAIVNGNYSYFTMEHHCHFCDEWWGPAALGGYQSERHADDCPIGQAIAFLETLKAAQPE
jgi:hypothetical protein